MRPGPVASAVILSLLVVSCASPTWDGELRSWGTVHEVMRFERTAGRVELAEAAASPAAVGLGALEGLQGEVLVLDGRVWVSRSAGDARPDARAPKPGERATLLFLAEVPRWLDVEVDRHLAGEELEAFVRAAARDAGLDPRRPLPFVLDGPLAELQLHVTAGRCPRAHPELADDERPFRAEFGATRGTLVGVFAEDAGGDLMHHGEKAHLHALVGGERPLVGHVDGVVVAPGAVLRLPVSD